MNKRDSCFNKDDEFVLEMLANLGGIVLRHSLNMDEQLVYLNNLRMIIKVFVIKITFIYYLKHKIKKNYK